MLSTEPSAPTSPASNAAPPLLAGRAVFTHSNVLELPYPPPCVHRSVLQLYVGLSIMVTSLFFLVHYDFKWSWWAVLVCMLFLVSLHVRARACVHACVCTCVRV